jgi:transposase
MAQKAMKKYKVTLKKDEHDQLLELVSKGSHSSQLYRAAYILLNCDEGKHGTKITNEQVSQVLKISMRMIDRIKQRFVEDGFEACLERKPLSKTKPKLADGELEAHLIALSCSSPPKGFSRWSLRLLADKIVELKHAEHISHETVRRVLKKTN